MSVFTTLPPSCALSIFLGRLLTWLMGVWALGRASVGHFPSASPCWVQCAGWARPSRPTSHARHHTLRPCRLGPGLLGQSLGATCVMLGPGLVGPVPFGKPHNTGQQRMVLGRAFGHFPSANHLKHSGAWAWPCRPVPFGKPHAGRTGALVPRQAPKAPLDNLQRIRPFARDCHEIATSVDAQFAATALTHQLRQTPKPMIRTRPLGPDLLGPPPIGKAQVEPTPTQCDTGMLLLTMP